MNQQLPHLYHNVLQLVVRVRQVWRRQDQQSPLFIELVQESAERLHVRFDLQRCKHTKSSSRLFFAFPGDGACERAGRAGLTFTPGGLPVPVATELADAAGDSPQLIPSVTAVLARRTVVVSIRGAGDVTVQRRRHGWAASHWAQQQRRETRTLKRLFWTCAALNVLQKLVLNPFKPFTGQNSDLNLRNTKKDYV